MITKKSKIFLAGHNGMVGSAILDRLKKNGYKNILVKSRRELDLSKQNQTFKFLKKNKPNFVILAAAKVGGILDNYKNKDKYIYENLQIQNNIIHGCFLAGVKNLFILGSSCIYPKHCKQPMKEKYLLTGPLEETNDAYSIAKIAGLKMCETYSNVHNLNYKSIMPPNLYGPRDNFDLKTSHFFPALIKKIYHCKLKKKKNLVIWGDGKAKRELMFVNDFADAFVYFMQKKIKEPFINIGIGKDFSITWYARYLMKKMKVKLNLKYDISKPNGMPRKCLDIKLAKNYGWKPKFNIDEGIRVTLSYFLKSRS